jgi:uncharacterized DUF497 family protein
MKFEWDENKRLVNLRKHGIDFADARKVFESERVNFIDDRFDYVELRFVTNRIIKRKVNHGYIYGKR